MRTAGPARGSAEVLAQLVRRAYAEAWDPEVDLAWDRRVEWDATSVPDRVSLLAATPACRRMAPRAREALKRREMASHLSALAYGEARAVPLAAQTALLLGPLPAEAAGFLGTLIADEAKHHATLSRYLSQKLRARYPPPALLERVLGALEAERDAGLNLLVGQVILEGSAASLLATLVTGVREPLLHDLLRRILRDEARHMRFVREVARPGPRHLVPGWRRRAEAILFDACAAAAACLLAPAVWQEAGLDGPACRAAAVDELRRRGLVRFFARVAVGQVRRHGFPADRLERRLEDRLVARLRDRA